MDGRLESSLLDTSMGLFEAASEAVVVADASGRILAVNSRTAEMFGYGRAELIGQPVEMLVPEKSRRSHLAHLDKFFESPHARPMGMGQELAARRKDGSEFPVEISLSFASGEHGPVALSFITDITERKRLEEQLLRSQRMEAVGLLAGGVAHDFNNLLTVIAGYNRLILDHLPPDHSMRGYAEEVLKASERAAALTDQLLAFSRRQVVQPVVMEINPAVANMQRMLRRLIGENIELHTDLAADAPRVKVGAGQIEQIVVNLAVNSRDAMPKGGRITVTTRAIQIAEGQTARTGGLRPGSYLMLSVGDTGSGIDAATRKRLFEPFFTTKEPGKGTGLGLSTVYGIVKQNNGVIWVDSEPGQGATFTIYLPAAREDSGQAAPEPAPASSQRGKETILLVEDQAEVRRLVREILVRQGYLVLEAASGVEAVDIAHKHTGPIHLLLTDIVMPGVSGREVAQQLQAMLPKIRVLYMSGYPENVVEGMMFLQKPFSPQTLTRKIRQVLDAL